MFFIFQEETVELKILNFKNLWNLLWKKNPSQGGKLEKTLDKLAQMACSVIIREKKSNADGNLNHLLFGVYFKVKHI